jgi:hypothetical protein
MSYICSHSELITVRWGGKKKGRTLDKDADTAYGKNRENLRS